MKKTPAGLRVLQYTILVLAAFFAFYPVWFAILASGRVGDRLYTLNFAGMFSPPSGPLRIIA